MKNIKKCLFALSFTFIFVMITGVVDVSAKDYVLEDEVATLLTGTELVLTKDDSLSFDGEYWFGGTDSRFEITSGEVDIQFDTIDKIVNMTIDGVVQLNKNFIVQIEMPGVVPGMDIVPVNLIINEDSILSVNGALAIPSGVNSIISNYGNLNINSTGVFEVRNRDNNYQGNGFLNVFGSMAIYGNTGNNFGNNEIHLHENANVYSMVDFKDNIVITKADTDTNDYELVENDKYYESISANIQEKDFTYGYMVVKKEVEEIPTIPSTDNNETTSSEINPETSDGIIIFLTLTIVGITGSILTYRRLHN